MVRTLLHDFLTEEQWADAKIGRRFNVRGSEGGEYRISCRAYIGNILVVRSRYFAVGTHLCCHPLMYADMTRSEFLTQAVITQKLLIENDEAYVMRTAHVYSG